jgi:Flp pilus assembly protein TadB
MILLLINPRYMSELWVRLPPLILGVIPCGWIVIGIGVIMMGIGIYVIQRIVDIEV